VTADVAGIVAPARTVAVTVSTGGTFPFTVTSAGVQQASSATGAARTQVAPDSPQVPQDSPGDPGGTDVPQEPPEATEAS
jgi:hypothetical protein